MKRLRKWSAWARPGWRFEITVAPNVVLVMFKDGKQTKWKPKAALEAIAVLLLVVSLGPPGCQKPSEPSQAQQTAADATGAVLPRLLDLGAGKCIPCKMMAPILEELKAEYAGLMEVVFIDVWQDRSAGERYRIKTIPCQIFYDASGKEVFRHEGFFSKADILAKWKQLGFDFQNKNASQ